MAEIVSRAQSGCLERSTTFNFLPNGSIRITMDGMMALRRETFRSACKSFLKRTKPHSSGIAGRHRQD